MKYKHIILGFLLIVACILLYQPESQSIIAYNRENLIKWHATFDDAVFDQLSAKEAWRGTQKQVEDKIDEEVFGRGKNIILVLQFTYPLQFHII